MADKNALMTTDDQPMLPAQNEWALMMDMARALVPTGFLPETIKKPEQAVAIMLKGRELRVPAMYALSNIAIVKGKPTVSAEMMLALIYRDHGKKAIRIKESTNDHCTIEYRLDGWDGTSLYSFSIDDAKQAGIYINMWLKYPAPMLRARCISAVARMAFPESIGGMYVPGELGDEVTITDSGEVLSVSGSTIDPDTGEIETPQDAWERASRRLHAVAGEHGIGHEVLHMWANENGFASTRDMPTDDLEFLAAELRANPDAAKRWAAKRISMKATPAEPELELIDIEPRPVTTGPPTDEEMDAALASATPTSLPFDVPNPEKYTR